MQPSLFDAEEPPAGPAAKSDKLEVVPFGKLKGQPIDLLLADAEYALWLMTAKAALLRKSHPELLTWLVKHFGAPETTPEHNLLQNRFLDSDFCLQLGLHLFPELVSNVEAAVAPERIQRGWEAILPGRIRYHYRDYTLPYKHDFSGPFPESHDKHRAKVLAKLDEDVSRLMLECARPKEEVRQPAEHGARTPRTWAPVVKVTDAKFEVEGADVQFSLTSSYCVRVNDPGHYHSDFGSRPPEVLMEYSFGQRLRVEVKPFVGDDYPVILRTMLAKKCNLLLIERFEADGASWDQLVQVFARRDIRVALLADVLVTEVPETVRRLPVPEKDEARLREVARQSLEQFDLAWVQRKREAQERYG